MSRVVDRVVLGSWTGTAGSNGSFAMTPQVTDTLMDFTDEFSCGVLTQQKPQPEAYWDAFPGNGCTKLNPGVSGFNTQFSGGGGNAKGVFLFRVDIDSVINTLNNSTQGGVQTGMMSGWQFIVATANRGRLRVYYNGQRIAERIITHGSGMAAPGASLAFQGIGGAGASSRVHRNHSCEYAVFNKELTPEEIYNWWFGSLLPQRGLVLHMNADNWLSGPPVNLIDPTKSPTSASAIAAGAEIPV